MYTYIYVYVYIQDLPIYEKQLLLIRMDFKNSHSGRKNTFCCIMHPDEQMVTLEVTSSHGYGCRIKTCPNA
jgi:hypothetical protein